MKITGVHPVAELFPMLASDELADLAEDIRDNGLRSPIVLDAAGMLLDGRNRRVARDGNGRIVRHPAKWVAR